jgi:hypothetical protein
VGDGALLFKFEIALLTAKSRHFCRSCQPTFSGFETSKTKRDQKLEKELETKFLKRKLKNKLFQ